MSAAERTIFFLAFVFFIWSFVAALFFILIGFLSHTKRLPKFFSLDDWQFLAFYWPWMPVVLLGLIWVRGNLGNRLQGVFHNIGVWAGKKLSK